VSGFERVADDLYTRLYEDEDARVCRDISDAACTVVSGNFLRNTLAQACTKLGDALINPKTTLPWLLTSLAAPGWIAGLLVPIRESGSMLPQLAIAAWMRRLPLRKWCYVGGAVAQGLAVLGLALTALATDGRMHQRRNLTNGTKTLSQSKGPKAQHMRLARVVTIR
jgi:hypothetical protein